MGKKKLSNSLSLADLKPNPNNPRLPFGDEQAAAFAKAYDRFGDLGGIVANLRFDYRLVGGHKRYGHLSDAFPDASIKLDTQKRDKQGTVAWGHVITPAGARYAVRIVDWPEEEEQAANLAANQFGAEFDWGAVSALLASMPEKLISMTGLAQHEVERLLAKTEAPADFKSFDESIAIEHECPKCGYKWSGGTNAH